MHEGRVNGSLNLSRALGDMEFKRGTQLAPAEQVGMQMPPRGQHRGSAWRGKPMLRLYELLRDALLRCASSSTKGVEM